MKIYVNSEWRVCALRSTERTDLMEIEVDREQFGDWCDAVILCYCYKIEYKKNADSNFILDAHGNKVVEYTTSYPAVDYNIIKAIQDLYNQNINPASNTMDDILVVTLTPKTKGRMATRDQGDADSNQNGETTFRRINRLYLDERLDDAGVMNAVNGGLITADEYNQIVQGN